MQEHAEGGGVAKEDGGLMEAADMICAAVDETAPDLFDAILGKDSPDGTDVVLAAVRLEYLLFALHITGRIITEHRGSDGSATFMAALLPVVQARLSDPSAAQAFPELCTARNSFYGEFPLPGETDSGTPKGTLFWEFGKYLAADYPDTMPLSVFTVSGIGTALAETLAEVGSAGSSL